MASDSAVTGEQGVAEGWIAVLAAPFAGSFLYALVRRLPLAAPGLWGRSRCAACGHALTPVELVPVVSFLAQRGRCRACGAKIPVAHLAFELACAAIAAAVWAGGAAGPDLWAGCVLGWVLLALAWIDATALLLPDALTLPLLLAGLAEAWLDAPWALTGRAAGAIAGYAGLRLLAAGYRWLRGREGVGQGDAKLLAVAGAWLGWPLLGHTLLLAALLGLAAALPRWRTLTATTRLPFGPPLCAAIFLLWLARDWLG